MMEEILSIDAPYFNAGIVLINQEVVYAAPILHYMKGWKLQRVISYVRKKGWRWDKVDKYVNSQTKESAYTHGIKYIEGINYTMQRARPKNNKSLH